MELAGSPLSSLTSTHILVRATSFENAASGMLICLDDILGFRPKLTVAVNPHDGSPVDAWLSPETRQYLHGLARSQQPERRRSSVASLENSKGKSGVDNSTCRNEHDGGKALSSREGSDLVAKDEMDELETIELPLRSDSEFFQILRRELANLDRLQGSEKLELSTQIVKLGRELHQIADSSSRKSKAQTKAWRGVFQLYNDSQVFFSSNEQDAGARNSQQASTRLQLFSKALAKEQLKALKMSKAAKEAVDHFIGINVKLLRFMKFQEINRTALCKIMKKFDKQTALRAQRSAPPPAMTQAPFVTQDFAKAICFTISEELLNIIPQLNDYLCPVCFSIAFKPIRLICNHVFCVRCLLIQQRLNQDHCPLCRGEVVMQASSCEYYPSLLAYGAGSSRSIVNLDEKLMTFLKAKFPDEVKAKQKENERAAGVDHYGEGYAKCMVM